MKHLLLILIPIVFFSIAAQAQFTQLVWSDEFDYNGLPDETKWNYDAGGHGWGNNELQYYTEKRTENARVENGKLIIEARKESYAGSDYTSARLVTRRKGDWKYGRIEVKAKLPGGRGSWPAIWMLPTDWAYGDWPASGEIDIMEYVGYDPGIVHGTVHTKDYNHVQGTQVGQSISVSDAETAFHVYALEWHEDKIDIFVDDTKYFTFNSSSEWEKWPFDKRFHLLLNIAVGGNWGGVEGVDDGIFPIRMEVDYVRVYQKPEALRVSGMDFLQPYQQGAIYSAANILGATYNWTVPEDAEIVSGQGTSQIEVNWGDSDGNIELVFTLDAEETTYTKNIKTVFVPQSTEGVLLDFETKNPTQIIDSTNSENNFTFSTQEGALKVSYDIKNKGAAPYFVLELERPVNMTNHSNIKLDIKTQNLSNSVISRLDLMDTKNYQTDYSPVFNLYEINADGQYHTYSHDFSSNWKTTDPYGAAVDKSKIRKLIFYVNFGFFGTNNAQDSLWIDNIRVSEAGNSVFHPVKNQNFTIYPNPAQDQLHLTFEKNIPANTKIQILSLRGKIITSNIPVKSKTICFDVSNYMAGIYILKIHYRNSVLTQFFIKQ